MLLPPDVSRFAETHFGLVTTRVLVEAGVSQRKARRLTADGQLSRLHPGVFLLSGVPRTWEQAQLAGCLATGGFASHQAAMRLWLPRTVRDAREWPVEVTVPTQRCPKPKGVTVHRSKDLKAGSTTRRGGIPVTNPLRTLGDLAGILDRDELGEVVDEAVVTHLLTIAGVRSVAADASRRRARGAAHLRTIVEEWPVADIRPDSVLELRFARLCKRAKLPTPVFQYEVALAGKTRRVDFAFPELRLAIEVDGFQARTNRRVFQDERRRQNDFALDGWTILRFTWHDITNDPDYVVRKIADPLASLGHERADQQPHLRHPMKENGHGVVVLLHRTP